MSDTAQFSVSKFSSSISKTGLASPNKFEMVFKRIPWGQGEAKQMNLMCDQATLAGRDVQAILDLQYGIRRQVVYNAPTYTPLSLSFLCSDQMTEKRVLDRWNDLCVGVRKNFNVGYYDDYIGELDVYVLDRSGKHRTYHMHYHEIYPKTVAAVELNHSTTNATLRITASFEYAYWTTKGVHRGSMPEN
tara:strand:- start:658 stop:1224 length:567 start_codon:yes stop_codon:yes gene_type:complete